MNNSKKPVVVLGGGISGLATAWFLHKAGIPFRLFEKNKHTGGKIFSGFYEGTVLDYGPNTIRDRNGLIRELVKDLSLDDDLITISEAFKTRFIVRDGKLHELSPNITSLLSTGILSAAGKLRVISEPFRAKGTGEDESIGSFLERRIGKEAVDYLVDPVFSGIYAGDIYRLSKKTLLGKLAAFEQDFGSIAWGEIRTKKKNSAVKPAVLSFRKGIQQFTNELTDRLANHITYAEVTDISPSDDGFIISCDGEVSEASKLISCIPAYQLARIVESFEPSLSTALKAVNYAPMLSTQVIYNRNLLNIPKSGFGFLVPRKENYRLLGAIWKSEIFPELSSTDFSHFTLMTGGAHDANLLTEEVEKIEGQIVSEFSDLMEIANKPHFINSRLWAKAIPQFEVNHGNLLKIIEQVEQNYPGLLIGGNYRWGISVPDCVEGAKNCIEMMSFH